MAREPVILNVYDMYWINDYLTNMGIGVYHSGVEIYGVEYAYGGHPLPFSGVFENSPRDAEDLGENFKFKESILLGHTDFSPADTQDVITSLGRDFHGDQYHLITKNCNHFSGAFIKTLCGAELPAWINRLAYISGSIPFLERMLPKEWLTPVALQQALNERDADVRSPPSSPPASSVRSPGMSRSASNGIGNFFAGLRSGRPDSSSNSSSDSSAAAPSTTSSSSRGFFSRREKPS